MSDIPPFESCRDWQHRYAAHVQAVLRCGLMDVRRQCVDPRTCVGQGACKYPHGVPEGEEVPLNTAEAETATKAHVINIRTGQAAAAADHYDGETREQSIERAVEVLQHMIERVCTGNLRAFYCVGVTDDDTVAVWCSRLRPTTGLRLTGALSYALDEVKRESGV